MLWEFWSWRRESLHQQGVQQSFLEHCPLTEPLRQAMWLFLRLGFVKKANFSKRHQLSQKENLNQEECGIGSLGKVEA